MDLPELWKHHQFVGSAQAMVHLIVCKPVTLRCCEHDRRHRSKRWVAKCRRCNPRTGVFTNDRHHRYGLGGHEVIVVEVCDAFKEVYRSE